MSRTAKAYGCASANNGNQFAELNAEGAGALYQDVLTKPGQQMNWRFYHRARTRKGHDSQSDNVIQSGTDTMAMVIAPLELVKDVTTQAQLEDLLSKCANHNGENYITENKKTYTVYVYQATATINNLSGTRQSWEKKWTGKYGWVDTYAKYSTSSWTKSNGTYKIPDGQYLTRFFFAAISTASGESEKAKTMGNLLDDVWFSQNVAPPTSGTGRVTVTKKFYGLTEAEAKTLGNSGFISYDRSVAVRGIADQALTPVDFSGDIWTNSYDENGAYVSVSHVFDEVVEANTDYTYYFAEDDSKANVSGYKLTSTLVNGAEGKNGSVTMNKENSNKSITFSNFYEKNTADVTLTKHVTGLMGDTHKEFAFSITGLDDSNAMLENGDLSDFTLMHNNSVILKNVPMDTVFAVVETLGADSGYETKATGHDTPVTDEARTFYYKLVLEDGQQVLMACDAEGNNATAQEGLAITVTNHCTLQPDLGVLLDTLPYIVILAVVAGGVALLMLRKRRKEDD